MSTRLQEAIDNDERTSKKLAQLAKVYEQRLLRAARGLEKLTRHERGRVASTLGLDETELFG